MSGLEPENMEEALRGICILEQVQEKGKCGCPDKDPGPQLLCCLAWWGTLLTALQWASVFPSVK